jgi:integrase
MGVHKKFNGKKITPKDKNWSRGTWYVWKRIGGRVVHRSLPEAQTKQQAEQAERSIVEQHFNRRYGITDSKTTFAEFATGPYSKYVEQKNVNKGAKRLYIATLTKHFKKRLLSEITPQDCRDVQWSLQKTDLSNSSVNRIMSTLSKIFTLACEEGILDQSPMRYVRTLEEPPPRNRILTKAEKERLWTELQKDSLLLRLVTLATNLPLRRGQLLAITPDAIDLENGVLLAGSSKGRASRLVPLNDTASLTFAAMLRDHQLPFPLKDFRKRWSRCLQAAGINEKGGKRGTNFTFHDLRHEGATELLRNNVNPEIVRRLYGHSDMGITQVYMNPEFEDMSKALKTLDATNVQPTIESEGPPN